MKTLTYKQMTSNLSKGIRNCTRAEDTDMDEVADAYGMIQTAMRVLEKKGVPEKAFLSRMMTGKLPKR